MSEVSEANQHGLYFCATTRLCWEIIRKQEIAINKLVEILAQSKMLEFGSPFNNLFRYLWVHSSSINKGFGQSVKQIHCILKFVREY